MVASGAFPNFTLTNQEGNNVNFYDALDNTTKGMIIFVYPKANTPGCTKQACGFRDHYDEIKIRGYEVLGMSRDKQAAQAAWKKSKNLPYNLVSDEEGQILKDLGCLAGNSTVRSVFVFDKETRSAVLDRIKVSPEESVAAVLKAITGEEPSESEVSDEGSSHHSHNNNETGDIKLPQPKAKAKAKAKVSRDRPPMEKKAEDGDTNGKKVPPTKRSAAKRSASADVAGTAAEKKKGAAGAAPRLTPTAKKASVKRSEPSGGVDEADGSPKGTKRARKAATGDEEAPAATTQKGAGARPRTASQPAATSRHPAGSKAKEKATTKKVVKEEPKAKSGKAAGGSTAGRPAAAGASKKGKK